jgi:hypothetical protein
MREDTSLRAKKWAQDEPRNALDVLQFAFKSGDESLTSSASIRGVWRG